MLDVVILLLAALFAIAWVWGIVKRIGGLFVHLLLGGAVLFFLYYLMVGR